LTLFFDGASKGNPGPAGYGYYITSTTIPVDYKGSGSIGIATNNVAEYQGLISGLTYLRDVTLKDVSHVSITIHGDSQLVINQVIGIYKVKNQTLAKLHSIVTDLLVEIRKSGHIVNLVHVVRKFNSVADQLASNASR
jgi:ribonuclease HI